MSILEKPRPKKLHDLPKVTCNWVAQQKFELRSGLSMHPLPSATSKWTPAHHGFHHKTILESSFSHLQGGNSSVPLNLCFLISLYFCNSAGLGVTVLLQIGYFDKVINKRLAELESEELAVSWFWLGPIRDGWFCLNEV